MTPAAAQSRPVQGRHVLAALIGFFAIVMIVNGVMIYDALSTFGGLDTPDAYRIGLTYNQRIAEATKQAQLGWQDHFDLSGFPRRISYELKDGTGQPIRGLNLTARLGRPATNAFDRFIALIESQPGRYEAEVSDLAAGAWIIDIAATAANDDSKVVHQFRKRLWLKP